MMSAKSAFTIVHIIHIHACTNVSYCSHDDELFNYARLFSVFYCPCQMCVYVQKKVVKILFSQNKRPKNSGERRSLAQEKERNMRKQENEEK